MPALLHEPGAPHGASTARGVFARAPPPLAGPHSHPPRGPPVYRPVPFPRRPSIVLTPRWEGPPEPPPLPEHGVLRHAGRASPALAGPLAPGNAGWPGAPLPGGRGGVCATRRGRPCPTVRSTVLSLREGKIPRARALRTLEPVPLLTGAVRNLATDRFLRRRRSPFRPLGFHPAQAHKAAQATSAAASRTLRSLAAFVPRNLLRSSASRKEPKRRRKRPKLCPVSEAFTKRRRKEPKFSGRGGVNEWNLRKEPNFGIERNLWRDPRASTGNLRQGPKSGTVTLVGSGRLLGQGRQRRRGASAEEVIGWDGLNCRKTPNP
nr:SH3 domain-binding protein 2-like [Microcebus murinus]